MAIIKTELSTLTRVQDKFEYLDEATGKVFRDAINLSAVDYDALSVAELDAMKLARYDSHVVAVAQTVFPTELEALQDSKEQTRLALERAEVEVTMFTEESVRVDLEITKLTT
jgi:hypothetical protein